MPPIALGHDGDDSEHAHSETPAADSSIGEALILPTIEGPKPWSAAPALTDPQRFSIAIVTDRTGGHRPGIWMKAVKRLNWLRPDFVVSVGDLIEGYTENDAQIEREWNEFLGFIEELQMKFFFVAGNHDVTNPKLHRIWREKFGKEWYSFDYHGVHFVCLSSEDPSAQLGEEQLVWLENDLKSNSDTRWTLVFLHKPLWTFAEREIAAGNKDRTNWKRVEKMLGDRPHTVFAGHVHHYVQYERNGQKYYSLATTGGGSQLRGVDYGEFDHITWLTMEQDGPRVANLLLDGIQPANVVTEDSIRAYRAFVAGVRVDVEPIFISGGTLQKGEIILTATNDTDSPVSVRANIAGLPLVGLDMKSTELSMELQPKESTRTVVPFAMKEPVDLDRFRMTSLNAKVTSQAKPPMTAEWSKPVLIDREYTISKAAFEIDGNLQDWSSATWWETEATPTLAGQIENWNGKEDASFRIAASFDQDRLTFAATVTDENVTQGDQLTVSIDPRPLLSRLATNRLGRETIAVTIEAPKSTELQPCKVSRPGADSDVVAYGRRTQSGYELEFSAPIDRLTRAQGDQWESLQMGARLSDVDAENESAVEILWRATRNPSQNRAYAHVLRK